MIELAFISRVHEILLSVLIVLFILFRIVMFPPILCRGFSPCCLVGRVYRSIQNNWGHKPFGDSSS